MPGCKGLDEVLRRVGVFEDEVHTCATFGLSPAVIIDRRDLGNIVVSPEDGMFEVLLEPGDPEQAGQPVRQLLWFIDKPSRPPEPLCSPVDGGGGVTRAIPVTEQGDFVFVVRT